MPPSSRKRNKGKERKAKQLAKKEEKDRADAHQFWQVFYGSNKCDHGCDVGISDDHPVSSFMDQFYRTAQYKDMTVQHHMKLLFQTYPHIWANESYRKLAIGILVNIGTNMMIRIGTDVDNSWTICIGQSIVMLEEYGRLGNFDLALISRRKANKWRDFHLRGSCNNSHIRDILKFFRKRTTCKCLKKMHLEARKSTPKMGICWHCKAEMERVALSVCSRCMVMPYCSRECQVAAWPEHERFCNIRDV